MAKATIRSLTRKGWSQKKIALKLHIRKSKVVAYQKALKIGKRRAFAEDVAKYREITGAEYKKAVQEVRFGSKWFKRKLKKLGRVGKAREKMRREWYGVKTGKIDLAEMVDKITEDEGLLSEAGYE